MEEELKRLGKENIIDPSASIDRTARIIAPVCLGKGVKVGKDCTIGPRVVLGNNCEVNEGVKIHDSVLLENCYIDAKSEISQAILGDAVKAGVGVNLVGPAVLGSNVYIEDQVTLKASQAQTIKVCPWVTISTESVEHAKSNGAFVH
ncbi:MAG: hypothetical protein Q6370_007255 [Candidatus Sigynarchaeota archaeon]